MSEYEELHCAGCGKPIHEPTAACGYSWGRSPSRGKLQVSFSIPDTRDLRDPETLGKAILSRKEGT